MSIACKWVHSWWGISNKISAWTGWTVKDRLIWTFYLNKENNNPCGNKADPKRVVKSRILSWYTHQWLVCLPPFPDSNLCFLRSLPYWPWYFHTALIFRTEISFKFMFWTKFFTQLCPLNQASSLLRTFLFSPAFLFHTHPRNTFYYLRRITSRTVLQKWYCQAEIAFREYTMYFQTWERKP